jgi:hypothetical protein
VHCRSQGLRHEVDRAIVYQGSSYEPVSMFEEAGEYGYGLVTEQELACGGS